MDVFYGQKYKCEIYSLQIENRGDDLDCTKENVIRDSVKNHTIPIILLSCGTQNSFMLKHMNFDHCQSFLLPLSRTASGRKRTPQNLPVA